MDTNSFVESGGFSPYYLMKLIAHSLLQPDQCIVLRIATAGSGFSKTVLGTAGRQ